MSDRTRQELVVSQKLINLYFSGVVVVRRP